MSNGCDLLTESEKAYKQGFSLDLAFLSEIIPQKVTQQLFELLCCKDQNS